MKHTNRAATILFTAYCTLAVLWFISYEVLKIMYGSVVIVPGITCTILLSIVASVVMVRSMMRATEQDQRIIWEKEERMIAILERNTTTIR